MKNQPTKQSLADLIKSLPEEQRAQFEAAHEAEKAQGEPEPKADVPEDVSPAVKAMFAQMQAQVDEAKSVAEKATERANALEAAATKSERIGKVRKLGVVGGIAEEAADLLALAEKAGPEAVEKAQRVLRGLAAQTSKGSHILAQMSAAGDDGEGSAETATAEIEKLAQEYARKESVSIEKARMEIFKLHPDLYELAQEEEDLRAMGVAEEDFGFEDDLDDDGLDAA